MPWGRGLLFRRGKVYINAIAHRKLWQNFILFGIIVVFRPALFKYYGTLEGKLLKLAYLNGYLAFLRQTFLGAENGNETAEHG